MRKLLLASALLASIPAAASAADLPPRAPPPVFTPVPIFTWTGFYAGFNLGYAFDTGPVQRGAFVIAPPFAPAGTVATFANTSQDGFTGGGQIGYNYQFTPGSGAVIGFEADAQYLDFGRDRRAAIITGGPLAVGFSVVDPRGLSSLDFFGTVRGRLGYAFDRTLIYGTGGFAYGSGSNDRSFGGFNGNDSFRTGWTAGGGVEWALSDNSFLNVFRASAVTFRIEGLYVNLDRGTRTQGAFIISNATNTPVVFSAVGRRNDEFAAVRAAVNYKFGSY